MPHGRKSLMGRESKQSARFIGEHARMQEGSSNDRRKRQWAGAGVGAAKKDVVWPLGLVPSFQRKTKAVCGTPAEMNVD